MPACSMNAAADTQRVGLGGQRAGGAAAGCGQPVMTLTSAVRPVDGSRW